MDAYKQDDPQLESSKSFMLYLRHLRIVSYYILLVHGKCPRGHGVGVEAMEDRLFAGLSEVASPLFVAQQGGKLVG
ncbi:MAG: hypothetical protein F4Z57_07660 [Gemmatimonadetes bacterium]|nr:hypothetical protein [Gemmatimonadota bacterium]MYC71887.1 hypothetical protein [Gemmatimonadota bacterium]MYI61916.1 hypothetical protein [Gemmatimonadota bacterium]